MATLFDGVLFPQSLQDLVKGIRAHRRDEAAYIRGKIAEITTECRSSEPHKKANGVLKLTYVSAHLPVTLVLRLSDADSSPSPLSSFDVGGLWQLSGILGPSPLILLGTCSRSWTMRLVLGVSGTDTCVLR